MNQKTLINTQKEVNSPLLQRANAAILSRDFTLAIRLFKRILAEHPNNNEILLQLASVYIRAGNDEKALEIYELLLKETSDDFDILMNLGGIYRRLKKFSESISVLEIALLTGNNVDSVKYSMGFTYKLMGDYKNAEDCFTDVIDMNPNDVLAYNHLGSILSKQKKYDTAQRTFSRGLQIDPNHPILHLNACINYIQIKDFARAKKHCEAALRAKPGWTEALTVYAELLNETDNVPQAQKVLEKAISLNPDNTDMVRNLAEFYSTHKDYKKAEDLYTDLVRLEPNNSDTIINLANTYYKQEKYREAVESYELIDSIQVFDKTSLINFANALIEVGRMDDAMEKISILEDKHSDELTALNMFSQFFIRNEEFSHAKEYLEKIKTLYPSETSYLFDNAKQYNFMEKYLESKKLLDKYIPAHETDASAWQLNGDNLRELKMYSAALDALKRSYELSKDVSLCNEISSLRNHFPEHSKELKIISSIENELKKETVSLIEPAFSDDSMASNTRDTEEYLNEKDTFEKTTDEDDSASVFSLDVDDFGEDPYDSMEPLKLDSMEDETDDHEDNSDLSSLVYTDAPVEYEPTETETLFDDFGKAYSQTNPIEDEDILVVDDAGFDVDFLNDDEDDKFDLEDIQEKEPAYFDNAPVPPRKTSFNEEPPIDTPAETSSELNFEDFNLDEFNPSEDEKEKNTIDLNEPEVEEEDYLEFLPDDMDCIDDMLQEPEYPDFEKKLPENNDSLEDKIEEIKAPSLLPKDVEYLYKDPLDSLDYEGMFSLLGDLLTEITKQKKANAQISQKMEEFDVALSLFEVDIPSDTVVAENKESEMMNQVRKTVKESFECIQMDQFTNSAEMFEELHDLYKKLRTSQKENYLLDELKKRDLTYVSNRLLYGPGLLSAAIAMNETIEL